ncbi:MAG: Maf family protein [Lachnospiraceae bacterium]|jgi:septum formation protein
MEKKIILCSGSPRRQELLKLLVPSFEIRKSDADETFLCGNPEKFAVELAKRKAKAVWEKLDAGGREKAILISADTSVWLNDREFGKPSDKSEAFEMIRSLSGRAHAVVTGVCVMSHDREVCFAEKTIVHVLPMSTEEIEAYVSTPEPYDKAGGYGIQGAFSRYISGIEGDYFNVVGLPVSHLWQALKQFGIS